MDDEDKLSATLELADEAEQMGYARYLCELYLKDNPDHVTTLIRYACNLISLGQYSLAKQTLDHTQSVVYPKRLNHVLDQRGHLLQAQGDFPAAEEMFMKEHALDPDDATHLIYAGSAAFAKGDIERAVSLARQAVECSEGCIDEAYFNLGGYLLSSRQYHEARECYLKALESDPEYEIAKKRLMDVELVLEHQNKQNAAIVPFQPPH